MKGLCNKRKHSFVDDRIFSTDVYKMTHNCMGCFIKLHGEIDGYGEDGPSDEEDW